MVLFYWVHRYSKAKSISSFVHPDVLQSPSRMLMSSRISGTFQPESAGAGKKSFFSMSTLANGWTWSTAQSRLIFRIFEPVVLLQSSLINWKTFRTTSFGECCNFSTKDTNALKIDLFTCLVPLSGSIRNRWVFLSTRNIHLIDTLHALKIFSASLSYKSHSTAP